MAHTLVILDMDIIATGTRLESCRRKGGSWSVSKQTARLEFGFQLCSHLAFLPPHIPQMSGYNVLIVLVASLLLGAFSWALTPKGQYQT